MHYARQMASQAAPSRLRTRGITIAERVTITAMRQHSDYFDSLEAAIIIGHKCQAVHRATAFVHERTEYGLTIWKGNVEIFDLKDHPTATACYAWSYGQPDRSRIFTILGNKIINSAQKAVQAAVCADEQPIKLIPPLTNGLGHLRQQMERATKIIRQVEIKSEELVVSIESTRQNHNGIKLRSRRNQPVQPVTPPNSIGF